MSLSALQNCYIYGIERKTILDRLKNTLKYTNQNRIVSIFGESGIGKSFVCRQIFSTGIGVAFSYKVLIDFNQIENKNMLGIIERIMANLSQMNFTHTQRQLNQYYTSIDASKSEHLRQCVSVFISELNKFASGQVEPILLIFDTYEALPVDIQETEFYELILQACDKIVILISGIEKAQLSQCTTLLIDGFNEQEIIKYLIERDIRFKSTFKRKNGNLLASRIRDYTKRGNPILCGLMSDCLLRCKDIDEQINYLLDEQREVSYQHLVSWIADLDKSIRDALRLTSYFNDRMNPYLLSGISGLPFNKCQSLLKEILNFSFVKSTSESDDENPQITLHDVVANLIIRYYPYTAIELHEFANKAVSIYDSMIASDRKNIDAYKEETVLRIERVLCIVRNGNFIKALRMFDNEIINALDEFDFSFTKQLISELEAYYLKTQDIQWSYIAKIAKAELLLKQYDIESASFIINVLRTDSIYNNSAMFKSITDSLMGRLSVNPCSLDSCISIDEAISILNETIPSLEANCFDSRIIITYYWLGKAYVRTGQNKLAYNVFEKARKLNTTNIQKIEIYLEISKMKRLQQNLLEAAPPLDRCLAVIDRLKIKNKGKYFYYRGNVYRDSGENELAVEYYDLAFSELEAGDDDFTLCELYLDYAWLEYLRRNDFKLEQVRNYLDEGWKLAQKYHFGTEYSEYYHMLYEMQHYLGDDSNAEKNLLKALKYAYQYSNIYMILDCLNHKVQMYFRKKQYNEIPNVICEMKRIEKSGCKIRVFRGRAMLVQADVYFKEKKYGEALNEYFYGFLLIALFGDSFTNVELFDDLYNQPTDEKLSRKQIINICIKNICTPEKYTRKFQRTWQEQMVSRKYDYFLNNLINVKL